MTKSNNFTSFNAWEVIPINNEMKLDTEQAIRISKIICQAPEERLPMILSVLEKANLSINGMEELEEWKMFKEQAYIIDIKEFVTDLIRDSPEEDKEILIRPVEFNEICRKRNLKPSCAKRSLNHYGYLRTCMDGEKLNYTVPIWVDGKPQRYVAIRKEAAL